MCPRTPLADVPDPGADGPTVAEEAAATLLDLPQARGNGALPSLATYLAFEAPTVDPLPFRFFRTGSDDSQTNPGLVWRAQRLAVGGRLLVARVRWLDEMVDSGRPLGTPTDVHRLSTAVHEKALSYFKSCLTGGQEAEFLACFARLEARHATSIAVDAASGGTPAAGRAPATVEIESYAEQAKARAMVASASVEAQLIATGASEEEKRRARECLEALAVAWQLGDDVLDLEEDYRDGRLSWIVSETLRSLPEDDPLPEPDDFYEVALVGGHVRRALEESLAYYRNAEQAADNLFPGALAFAKEEAGKAAEMLSDLAAIVSAPDRR